ncbi:MAG: SRPBCC family protein [Gemmatimonadales bacterium]
MVPSSQTAPLPLRLARTIAAPRETVFRAWTDPKALRHWAAPGDGTAPLAEVDLRVGGRYRIHIQAPDDTVHKVTGVYQAVDPQRRLVYTWFWETGPEQGDTLVTVEFHERGGATEVIQLERFPSAAVRDGHEEGWTSCLRKLSLVFADDRHRG